MSEKKKRRRSSLAPKRISMITSTSSGVSGLHSLIDPELPDDVRLAKLSSLCLEYTLNSMEVTDCPHSEWFKSEAQDKVNQLLANLQEDGLFKKACQTDGCNSLVSDAVKEVLAARIADAEASINSLETESEKWDNILNELDEKVKQAELENEKKGVPESEIPDKVKILSRDYYTPSADISILTADIQQNVNKAALAMEESCCSINMLKRTHQKITDVLETQCSQLRQKSFQGIESPREQIRNRILIPEITDFNPKH